MLFSSFRRPVVFAALVAAPLFGAEPSVAAPQPAESSAASTLRSVAAEAEVLKSGRITARQRALARLAVHPDPTADQALLAQFDKFRAGELPPALWLDLFEAAAKRGSPELTRRIEDRQKELEKSTDPLSRFRECLEGGDGAAGREIFMKKPEAGCVRCHTVDGVGGKIGPDLTWLRNAMDRTLILESIIVPNAVIAPGFQSAALKLKDESLISGVVNAESEQDITLTSVVDGTKQTVSKASIVERTPLPSPMPPHFGAVLDKRAIRDLVAFIAEGD